MGINIDYANEHEIQASKLVDCPIPKKVSKEQYKYVKIKIDGLKKGLIHKNKVINKYQSMQRKGQKLTPGQEQELAEARQYVVKSRAILDDFVYEMVSKKSNSKFASKITKRMGYATVYDYLSTRDKLSVDENRIVSYREPGRFDLSQTEVIAPLNNLVGSPMAITDRYDLEGQSAPTLSQQEAFLSDMPNNLVESAARHR